jgi:N-methylhydantoinase B
VAEQQMRRRIAALPDGSFSGSRLVEDLGHGLGDLEVGVTAAIAGDRLRVALSAPPQIPFYTNSYRANTTSAVYLGLIMFLQPEPPFNEGMYRPIEIDFGPPGSLVNAVEPAPHVACTTCPAETITDAVRDTLSLAYPDRAVAGWGHCSAVNCAGLDPRSGNEYVHMMVSCLMCGAGAVGGVMDGWHGVGPQAGLGGGAAGDMELIEYQYPLVVHRYGFATDSANPGEWRGGSGLVHEVEALDHRMTAVVWGEGRKFPASSVASGGSARPELKVGSVEIVRNDGAVERVTHNCVLTLSGKTSSRASSRSMPPARSTASCSTPGWPSTTRRHARCERGRADGLSPRNRHGGHLHRPRARRRGRVDRALQDAVDTFRPARRHSQRHRVDRRAPRHDQRGLPPAV